PRDLETICMKCLEKEPRRRYASAGELVDDLRRFRAGEPTRARPLGPARRMMRWARRRPGTATLAASLVTVVLVGLGLVLWQWNEAIRQRTAAHFQTYRARVAAAIAALQGHDVTDARRQLDLAPEDLRVWEWQHLHGRLDESSRVIRPAESER